MLFPTRKRIIAGFSKTINTDVLDASLTLQFDAGLLSLTAAQIALADVNGDGKADALDASLILQFDAGLINGF